MQLGLEFKFFKLEVICSLFHKAVHNPKPLFGSDMRFYNLTNNRKFSNTFQNGNHTTKFDAFFSYLKFLFNSSTTEPVEVMYSGGYHVALQTEVDNITTPEASRGILNSADAFRAPRMD